MKRYTKLAALASGALLVLGSFSACSHRYREPEYRANKMVERISSELELNDGQRAKLEAMSSSMLNTRKAMREQFNAEHEQLHAMLQQPTLDQAKLLDMVHSHTRAIDTQAPKMIAQMADFYQSLSAEQRSKLSEHMEKMRSHFGHGHHHGEHG